MKKILLLASTFVLALFALPQTASAGIKPYWDEPVPSQPTPPPLPPCYGEPGTPSYRTAADVHADYANGVNISFADHQPCPQGRAQVTSSRSGDDQLEHFESTFVGTVTIPGLGAIQVQLNGPVDTKVMGLYTPTWPIAVGSSVTFDTEMLAMALTGTLSGQTVIVRESPTLQSTGKISIDRITTDTYRLTSFFDIFTELSLDGGQTWSVQTNGPTQVNLQSIPEPSTFMLMGMGVGLLGLLRKTRSS